MDLAKTRLEILRRLKTRGPQTIKILASQLDITTMGVRQHITELEEYGLVSQTPEARQTRGRPVHSWQLTAAGHRQFPDNHASVSARLLDTMRDSLGEEQLNQLIQHSGVAQHRHYRQTLDAAGPDLESKLQKLAELRSDEGFMAEIRLLPDGWMLIENHCPILTAARCCQQFCESELTLFQSLLSEQATVERIDHVLAASRRCAYRIRRCLSATEGSG